MALLYDVSCLCFGSKLIELKMNATVVLKVNTAHMRPVIALLHCHVYPPLRLLWLYRFAHTATGLSPEAVGAGKRVETPFWDWSEETEKAVSGWPVCKSMVTILLLLLPGAFSENAGCVSPQARFRRNCVSSRLGCLSRVSQSSRSAIAAAAQNL